MENDSTKGFTMALKALHKGSKKEGLIQIACPSPEQNQASETVKQVECFSLSYLHKRLADFISRGWAKTSHQNSIQNKTTCYEKLEWDLGVGVST